MIAMCLAAGQKTVPDDFTVHSCHCYFILAGSSEIPVLFHVERVRDGRSFATRTVQARQKGKCIFTTTMSFTKETQPNPTASPNHEFKDNVVRHAVPMPMDPTTGQPVQSPPRDFDDEPELTRSGGGPFQSYRAEVVTPSGGDPAPPHTKKLRQWYRARGKISEAGGHQAHINALAYVSDSYFIGTVSRIHKLWRFPFAAKDFKDLPDDLKDHIRKLNDFEGYSSDSNQGPDGRQRSLEEFAEYWKDRPEIGMMVSLDHSIYFHAPRSIKADEWMLSEMESPWSGDGRGVVTQRIFAADGTLLATCFQEVSYSARTHFSFSWSAIPISYLTLTFESRASLDSRSRRLRPAPKTPRSQSCKVIRAFLGRVEEIIPWLHPNFEYGSDRYRAVRFFLE